jgi:hypothetical protein
MEAKRMGGTTGAGGISMVKKMLNFRNAESSGTDAS